MATTGATGGKKRKARQVVTVSELEELVGAHPDALRDFFSGGAPTDATALGGERDGVLLSLDALADTFVLTRPLVRGLSRMGMWKGLRFESGGTAGRDRWLGGELLRFRCEVAPSVLDGKPSLVLRFDGLQNPWPINKQIRELRTITPNIAIGFTAMNPGRHARVLGWWGLSI